ncbi:MAG: GPO family capsid scaffolding protein [Rouxiella aceris]|uniref:GPO family capsid scaffolding protein n=1 Tax=Rouxiella aceris TaxID=2703884 RepID=UPI0028473FB9|nr:GPO family capsid scaffolding protein [Rouxiella aceris]MDR3432567.1 GPO family capsid scaffolding protein [Rouxiella aceris]
MPQSHYRTDWLCIATSGQAVDGRTIEPQWLIDAAETYTRNTYTALIWPYHPQYEYGEREFTCNLGEVDALKTETVDGVVKLYAQLIPNRFLICANEDGQKLFTSAEFMGDFAGSGREYLIGIAVTDIPASLGTEKIKFQLAGEEKDAARGNLETFSLGKLKTQKKESSLWSKFFSPRKEFTPTPEPNTDKPNEGEEAKMDELKALLEQMIQLLSDGQAAAEGEGDSDTPELAADEVAGIADQIADAAAEVSELAQDVAENPEDEVVAAEFSAAKSNLVKAMKAFNVKSTKAPRRARRQFSARRQVDSKTNALTLLSTQLTNVMTKLSAQESGGTPRPNRAPGGSNKPFDFT